MKQRATTERVLMYTAGAVATLHDFLLCCLAEGISLELAASRFPRTGRIAARWLIATFGSHPIRQAIRRLRTKGLVDQHGRLTAAGRRGAAALLPPRPTAPARWNGRWYVVTYDIPERLRDQRDAFRDALKRYGFGRANASTWISPWDRIAEIEAAARDLKVSHFLLPAISDRLGRESGHDLARRIWRLDALNQRYHQYIDRFGARDAPPLAGVLAYKGIACDDPKLPRVLLPPDWRGDRAAAIAARLRTHLREQTIER